MMILVSSVFLLSSQLIVMGGGMERKSGNQENIKSQIKENLTKIIEDRKALLAKHEKNS